MAETIKQKVTFALPPNKLFKFYMDEKLHSKITGDKAKVSKEIGSSFSAGGKYIKGKMLHIKPNKMIVQTWRGSDWDKSDADSILILTFSDAENDQTQLEMVHANVPEEFADDIKKGWKEFYWDKWKVYIKSTNKPIKKSPAVKAKGVRRKKK